MYGDVAENEPFQRTLLRESMPTLAQFGIAIENFPDYVNLSLDLHGLDVVLLTFVLAGRGHHVVGDVDYAVTAPSVGVTRTGEVHSLVTDDDGLEVVNVYLDVENHPLPHLSQPLDHALTALLPFSTAAPDQPRLTQVSLSDGPEVRTLLELISVEAGNPRSGTADALSALRRLLLTFCARSVFDGGLLPEYRSLTPIEETIERVRAHLELTFLEAHSLTSLAELAHLESTYFSRMFSQIVGVPVTEYTTRLRIRHAVAELQSTDTAIAEIAAASGFRDLSHFGRTFRRITGTTPRAYRTWHRALADS